MENNVDAIPIEQTLQYTQGIRKGIIRKIVKDSNDPNVPEDKTEANLLVNLLNGMDKVALTQMKIKSEEKRDTEGAKAIVAAFLSTVNANDLATKRTDQVNPDDLSMPDDIAALHDKVTDERQMAIGTQHDTVEKFNERMAENQ